METGNFRDTIRASDCIYIIGVAGDSGSGKTTFTQAFRAIFGPDLVCAFSMDDYHLLDRDARAEQGITPPCTRMQTISPSLRNIFLS
ncbi:hypothetical protein [Methanogenium cariaci]|uniref:hypothetical protein n=1 Tax=Methanogenium cariaci TaxID=2197 RepID=UPI0024809762|nr:hypothetical protein [Methanogenium cariaci]